jgi:hypothetical protein
MLTKISLQFLKPTIEANLCLKYYQLVFQRLAYNSTIKRCLKIAI